MLYFWEILTTIVGVVMSLAYYPQAYQVWKRQSSRDISLLSYSILSFGTVVWTTYGVLIGSWPIVISFIPGVIGSWLVFGLAMYYRRAHTEIASPSARNDENVDSRLRGNDEKRWE